MAVKKTQRLETTTEKLLGGDYWDYIQWEYSGKNLIYEGRHRTFNASDDDENWLIIRYTYVGANPVTFQKTYGSWTNRASLGW